MVSFAITLKGNTLEAQAWFLAIAKKHVPFATAATLTEVAREGRDEMRARASERFDVRSRRFGTTFRHDPAEKRDWPKVQSAVGVLDEWVARHELGGTVKPEKAGRWAIPIEIRRTKSGKIRRSQRPKALLESGRAFERGGAILERFGRGAKKVRTAYVLRKSAKLKERLRLVVTVTTVTSALYGPAFKKWMLRSLN